MSPHGAALIQCFLQLRLFVGAHFSVSAQTAPPPRCECVWGFVFSPHGALRAYTVFPTDRASPRLSDGGGEVPVTAWRTTCLYGVSYRQSLAEALR